LVAQCFESRLEEDAMPARFLRRSSLTLIGVVASVVAMANPAVAPPGDLDTSFDGDGKVTTDFGSERAQARGVASQGDGKIVAAGRAIVAGNDDFALTRYNNDGSLDSTFDGDGKVTTDFAGELDRASGIAIQGDGRIVAAGGGFFAGTLDFGLTRYNPDGSLDTTFGGDGKVTTDFAGSSDQATGMAIQVNGKIVAAGRTMVAGNSDFALTRHNADGSLDPTFSGDGRVATDFGAFDEALAIAVQGDGKIVAVGFTTVSGNDDFALSRYNTDGSLDPTFSGDGKVTTDFAGSVEEAFGVAVQGDGRIVAAGFAIIGTLDFALARYNVDGSLDPTFSGDGKVTTDFGGGLNEALGVAIQTDGRILAAGHTLVSGNDDFGLARYNSDGSLDTTFSADGKVTTDFAGDFDEARAVAIQANGRIVAAGFTAVSGTEDFALARYTCVRHTSRRMSIPLCG
jgi:uncharacterized delta-60 repeat protein